MSYYAVRIGRVPGIYTNWNDASAQVKGYSGSIFKKFYSLNEAQMFMKVIGPFGIQNVVYTDGSYANWRMGMGIFYGDNDPRNRSLLLYPSKLTEYKSTNNIAEIMAIEYVIDHLDDDIIIYTDSNYSIQALVDGLYHQNISIVERIRNKIHKSPYKVSIQKVEGHSGNYGNDQADHLATMATN